MTELIINCKRKPIGCEYPNTQIRKYLSIQMQNKKPTPDPRRGFFIKIAFLLDPTLI